MNSDKKTSIKVTLTRAERFFYYKNKEKISRVIVETLKRMQDEKKKLLGE